MSQQGGYAGLLHELQGGALPAPQQTGTGGYAALLHEAQAGQQPLAQPAYAQAPSSDYLLTGTPAPGENRPNVNQPYMPPQPAPRSVAGEFGAAVFRGAETMLAAPRALAFNQPVSELVTPGFEPSPAPAGAGLIRRGAHTTAQVAGGLVPAIGAGVVTAGAATPFIAPMLGTGLAATAASGVAGGVPIATQMAADMSERTGGDPAAVAASFGQNAALGAIPPLAVLNRIPGVRNVVGKAVERFGAGPVMKYLAEVTGDAAVAGGTNVGQAYVDEAIASRAGAAPREVDPVAEFLGGAGAVGALRFASDVGRIQADRARKAKERNAPLPTREQIDAEIAAIFARMTQKERAIAEEQIVIDEIKQRMADPKFDPTSQLGQLREQVLQEFGVSGRRADRLIAAVRGRAAVERAFFQGDKPSAPNIGLVYQAFADENAAQRAANRSPMPVAPGERPEPKIVSNRSAQTIDPRLIQQIIDEYSAARAGPMTQAEGSAGPYRYTGPAGERLNIPTPREYPRALGADEAFAQKYELDPTFGGEILPLEDATWAASTMNAESKLWDYAIVQASADGERWVIARKGRARGGRGGGGGGQAQDGPDLPPYMRQFQPLTNKQQTTNVSRESVAQPIPSPQTPGVGTGAGRVEAEPVQTGGLQGGGPARPGQSTEPDFSSMTYAQLRQAAKDRGIQAKGNKAELVRALSEKPTPDVPAQAAEDWRQIPDTRTDLNRRIEEKKAQGMSHEDAFKAAQEDLTSEASARLDQDGAILVDEYGDEYLVEHTSSRRGGPKDQRSLVKLTEDGVPYASPNERPWVNPYESLLLARRLRRKIKQTPTPDVPAQAQSPSQTSVRDLALQEQARAGWNPAWPFVPVDLQNERFRRMIASDPKLDPNEKQRIFDAGRNLGVIADSDVPNLIDLQNKENTNGQERQGQGRQEGLLKPDTAPTTENAPAPSVRGAEGVSPESGMVIRSDWAGGSGVRMRLVRPYTHPTGNGWMVNVYDESSRRFSKVEQAVSDQDVANAIGKGRAESASATSPPQPPSASSAPRENGAEGVAPAKEPWQMTQIEAIGEYKEPVTAEDIRRAEKSASASRSRFEQNTNKGGFVPPPIKAEIGGKIATKEASVEQMREQYRAYAAEYRAKAENHYNAVADAVRQGRPVPPEVLADYPDLAAKSEAQAPSRLPPAIRRPVMPDFTSQAPEVQNPAAMVSKSGRKLEPYPDKPATTEAMTRIRLRQADEWLIREAIKEAESIGDDYNATGFRAEYNKEGKLPKGGLPQASRDAAHLYLFGREQTQFDRSPTPNPSPEVPPPVKAQAQNPDGGVVTGRVAQGGKGTGQTAAEGNMYAGGKSILSDGMAVGERMRRAQELYEGSTDPAIKAKAEDIYSRLNRGVLPVTEADGMLAELETSPKPETEAKAAAEAPPVNDRLDVVDPNDPDSIIAEIQAKVPQAYYGKASPDDAPWVTRKYQEAGTALVPGVRLGEAEDVGRVYHMMMEGVVSLADYTRLVSELRASGKAPKSGTDSDLQRPTTTEKHKSSVDPETYRNVVQVVDRHRSDSVHFKNTDRHKESTAALAAAKDDVRRVVEDVRRAVAHLPETNPNNLDLPATDQSTWKKAHEDAEIAATSADVRYRELNKAYDDLKQQIQDKAKRLGWDSPSVAKLKASAETLYAEFQKSSGETRDARQKARRLRMAVQYAEGDPVGRAIAAINLASEGKTAGYEVEQARIRAAFKHIIEKTAPDGTPPEVIESAAEGATQAQLTGTSRTMLESVEGRLANATAQANRLLIRKAIDAGELDGLKSGLSNAPGITLRNLENAAEKAESFAAAQKLLDEAKAQAAANVEQAKVKAESDRKAAEEARANSIVIDEPDMKVWWYGNDEKAKAKAIKEIQSITTKPVYTRTRYPGDPTTRKWPVWKGRSEFKGKADMLKELATFTGDASKTLDLDKVHIDQDGGRAMAMNGPWLVGVLGKKGEYGAPTTHRAPDVEWMVNEVFDPSNNIATVNVLDTARHLKRAKLMASEATPGALVVKNTDGTLGFATRSPGDGHAEINVKDGGEVIGMVNPEYMLNALLFAQQNGAIDVRIGHKWTTDNNKKAINRISIDGTNGSAADRRGAFVLLSGFVKQREGPSNVITQAKGITDTRPEDARPAPKGKPEQSSPSPQSLGIVPPGTRELWAAIDRAEQIVDRLGEGARITQRAAAFIFGKATTYARLLGPEGKDIARSMERIQKDTTQNTNTDVQAIKKTLAGLSREDVRIVAKIANGRGNWADTRPDLVPYVEKLRPHFDRVMLEARRVGIMRGKGPKKVILEGSGAYVPEVPNAEGRKFIEEIRDPNQSDKQSAAVAAWADKLVADGVVNTPEEAIKRLVDYRDRLRRGLQPYLESFRVPLPEHMVEWDIRETVPPVLERSWQTVEAVREWNSDPKNALGNDGSATLDLLTAKLERIRKSKGNAPADAIQAWADYSFGKKAPNPAQSAFFGAWSNFETLTRLGGSLLSAATNYTQQFVNTARLSPAAVAKAFKDYPPFLHPFMKSAVEARELAERAGGVSDVSALAPLEGQHAGYKLARAALYPFRRVEVTNQVRTSLAAAHQAVADMDLLIRMDGKSPLSWFGKAFESLGSLSGVDTTGGLKRRAAAMLDITPEQLAAKVKRHERLTPEEIADVMHRFSRDTQFLMGVATEPAWFRQSPIGRLAFKFKTWGARQLGLIYRDVVKEARYGNFAPLVRFTVATVVLGEIVQALRDWVKETENSATMYVAGGGRDTGEIAGRVLKSMAGGGAFGMLSDLTYGLGSFAFGPAGSTLGNVADAASGAKDAILTKGGEGLGAVGDRFLRNQIPAYTQADRLFDKTVAAASGDLSELKRQTTLRLWRQRAMDFAKSKQERTVGQKVAGRIDDAIYGRYRVAGEANENTRPFEYAARAIDRGDVDEAADYLRIVLKNTPTGEMDSKVRAIESSLRIRAPLGRVAEKDYGKFLSTYTPEQRREAIKADNRWRADYSKAIGRAMANRWARDDAAD